MKGAIEGLLCDVGRLRPQRKAVAGDALLVRASDSLGNGFVAVVLRIDVVAMPLSRTTTTVQRIGRATSALGDPHS
eukprot:6071006-Amphidinium_carterae.1